MVEILTKHFPDLAFSVGNQFVWSPAQRTVYYDPKLVETPGGSLALLHEISHALLGHQTYQLDIELLNMEVEAWIKARELAGQFNTPVSEDHIENCLDTYRIWLFKRSRCPTCTNTSPQQDSTTYRCFVCGSTWKVASSQSLRPRRMRCVTPV